MEGVSQNCFRVSWCDHYCHTQRNKLKAEGWWASSEGPKSWWNPHKQDSIRTFFSLWPGLLYVALMSVLILYFTFYFKSINVHLSSILHSQPICLYSCNILNSNWKQFYFCFPRSDLHLLLLVTLFPLTLTATNKSLHPSFSTF